MCWHARVRTHMETRCRHSPGDPQMNSWRLCLALGPTSHQAPLSTHSPCVRVVHSLPAVRAQGEAIAYNLREMFGLRVPIISVVIGEGGSGGALAIGCANRNLIMENSVYYVASPEACAAILWKSRDAVHLVSMGLGVGMVLKGAGVVHVGADVVHMVRMGMGEVGTGEELRHSRMGCSVGAACLSAGIQVAFADACTHACAGAHMVLELHSGKVWAW